MQTILARALAVITAGSEHGGFKADTADKYAHVLMMQRKYDSAVEVLRPAILHAKARSPYSPTLACSVVMCQRGTPASMSACLLPHFDLLKACFALTAWLLLPSFYVVKVDGHLNVVSTIGMQSMGRAPRLSVGQ